MHTGRRLPSATLIGPHVQGEWVCPECAAGKAPPARRATTARERFLQQQGLALARIEAIWRVRALKWEQWMAPALRCLPLSKVQLPPCARGGRLGAAALHRCPTAVLPRNPACAAGAWGRCGVQLPLVWPAGGHTHGAAGERQVTTVPLLGCLH